MCPFLQIKIENQWHGSVTLRYSTSDSVKQNDESLAGPINSSNSPFWHRDSSHTLYTKVDTDSHYHIDIKRQMRFSFDDTGFQHWRSSIRQHVC